jgi:hypothetical protein
MGRINVGGVNKRTGDNINVANSVVGTTLKLTPPKGYYDGSTGRVTITSANFTAGNIKQGINLFGITGNLQFIESFESQDINTQYTKNTLGTQTNTIKSLGLNCRSFQITPTTVPTDAVPTSISCVTANGDGLNASTTTLRIRGATSGSHDLAQMFSSTTSGGLSEFLVSCSGVKKIDGTWQIRSLVYDQRTNTFKQKNTNSVTLVGGLDIEASFNNVKNSGAATLTLNFNGNISRVY